MRSQDTGREATDRTPIDCATARAHLSDEQRGRLALDAQEALAAHLADCAACRREDQAERLLSEQLDRHLPQHAAPLALKRRLAAQWPVPAAQASSVSARRPAPALLRAAAIAAVALAAVAATIAGALWLGRPAAAERLVGEAVNDHLRIIARASALDVASGDMHQVRPWLTSRLDFAPVVPFAGDAEFPLRGGTVEHFLDRRTAVAVYGRRLHAITLLVLRPDGLDWPAPGRSIATRARGFNVRLWQTGGLGYALISDVDGAELARLATRLGS